MRKMFIAAALSAAFVTTAVAKQQGGTIISIDDAAKTFVCEWNKNNWTYKTTAKTSFRTAGKSGSFSDLKPGVRVNVGYHLVGKDRVADWVTINVR